MTNQHLHSHISHQPSHARTVIIIMAHGSRKKTANDECEAWVNVMKKSDIPYADITHCFLELSPPSLQQVVEEYIAKGYQQFALYPLFFSQGHHVQRDIPDQINTLTQQYPHIHIHIHQLDYFGMNPRISASILEHIQQQSM